MTETPSTIDVASTETGKPRLTNEFGLPAPIVNAIRGDDYSRGDCDFTVTELIKPVRIRALSRKWRAHLVEDVSDRIFSLFGRAMHKVLEQASDPRYCMVEKRYYWDCDMHGALLKLSDRIEYGVRISGQFDLYDYVLDQETGVLSDYKLTSRYATGDGVKPEWTQQMNCNAFLLRKNGISVKSLQIVALFRDWSKMRAAQSKDYPKRQVQLLPVTMWSDTETEQFIRDRIKAHVEGETNPPVCSPQERWERPTKFALMKKGQKKAVKLFDERHRAETVATVEDKRGTTRYYVEERPGENIRCLHYCNVNKFCSFFQELMQAKI